MEAVRLKKIHKIRIGHDGLKAGDGWFLEKVVTKPLNDVDQEVIFECNRYDTIIVKVHLYQSMKRMLSPAVW